MSGSDGSKQQLPVSSPAPSGSPLVVPKPPALVGKSCGSGEESPQNQPQPPPNKEVLGQYFLEDEVVEGTTMPKSDGGLVDSMDDSDSEQRLVIDTGSPTKPTPPSSLPTQFKNKISEEEIKHSPLDGSSKKNKDEPNKKTVEKSVTEESSKSNKAKSPYAVKNSDKKAAEAKASKGKGPVAKRRSITETAPKFDDVENAMEALFAGVEDESGGPKSSSSTKPPPPTKETKPATAVRKVGRPPGSFKKKPPPVTSTTKRFEDKLSPQDRLVHQFGGPFVHVEGKAKSPKWNNIINSSLDPLRPKEGSPSKKNGFDDRERQRRVSEFGVTSTIDPAYDARRADQSWACIFCKRPTHFRGLGDLFGPYFVSNPRAAAAASPLKKKEHLVSKFILGGETKKKRKRQHSSEYRSSDQTEVWFHEDCICWMPDVALIGRRLIGLDEAVEAAGKVTCRVCGQTGATMPCVRAGCKDSTHFVCAKSAKWNIEEEDFQAYCQKHSK